jgi:CheY-like chemotaxis protein
MIINMQKINILIIEDDQNDFIKLKKALTSLDIDDNNIYPTNHSELNYVDINELYKESEKIISKNDIDVIFFDIALEFGQNASNGNGSKLIKLFLNDEELNFIPKIILSGATNMDQLDHLVEQEAKIVLTKQDNLKKLLVDNNLNQTIPIFAKLYREIKQRIKYKKTVIEIKNNINKLENLIIDNAVNDIKELNLENVSKDNVEDIIKLKIPFLFGEIDLNTLYKKVDDKLMTLGVQYQNKNLGK